jgi:hypothetical protein
MELSNIINVTLTRETRTVSQVGFGTILILGPDLNVAQRTARYTSLTALALEVVGGVDSLEYKAAAAILSQSPRVTSFVVGYQSGDKVLTDDDGTYTAGDSKVMVNGDLITQSFSVDKDTTLTALAAQIQAHAAVATAVYSSVTHTITITPNTDYLLSIDFDLSGITGTMTWTLSSSALETMVEALTAIRLYDDDWYGTVITDRTQGVVEAVAAWAEANGKVFATASADADIVDVAPASDTTSVAATLKAAGYDRTVVFYDPNAATAFMDAAALGKVFPHHPGSWTLKFKTLNSITRTILSETQSYNARNKNCHTYETTGGVNILAEGKSASGEFFDVIVFCDWLVARVQESVYSIFVKQLKVPFDEGGINAVRSAAEPPFAEGVVYQGLRPLSYDSNDQQNGGYYFIVPAFEDISSEDLGNRTLDDMEAIGFLAGAIHNVAIAIKITL